MKKYLLFFIFLTFNNISLAENKIVYLDVSFLLNESIVGKDLNQKLLKINSRNVEEFKQIESKIKKDDNDLLKKKNIIKEDQYKKEVALLRQEYKSFKELMNKKNSDLNTLKDSSTKVILKNINDILAEYSTKNSISMIIEKKNIVIGKSDLDVTNEILDLLNKKITTVELK
jgi:outer membrane protein